MHQQNVKEVACHVFHQHQKLIYKSLLTGYWVLIDAWNLAVGKSAFFSCALYLHVKSLSLCLLQEKWAWNVNLGFLAQHLTHPLKKETFVVTVLGSLGFWCNMGFCSIRNFAWAGLRKLLIIIIIIIIFSISDYINRT